MRLPEFCIKLGPLCFHNKEQWDMIPGGKIPLIALHWHTKNSAERIFAIGHISGYCPSRKIGGKKG